MCVDVLVEKESQQAQYDPAWVIHGARYKCTLVTRVTLRRFTRVSKICLHFRISLPLPHVLLRLLLRAVLRSALQSYDIYPGKLLRVNTLDAQRYIKPPWEIFNLRYLIS